MQRENKKNTYKLLGTLKAVQRKEYHQISYDYVTAKTKKTPIEAVLDIISSGLLDFLKQTSSRTLSRVDRLYLGSRLEPPVEISGNLQKTKLSKVRPHSVKYVPLQCTMWNTLPQLLQRTLWAPPLDAFHPKSHSKPTS